MLNEIAKATEQLLAKNNFVVWPKIGAFVVERRPAQLHESGEFSAPVRFIAFNHKLTTNDGLLLNALAQNLNLAFDQTEKQYFGFQKQFIELLQAGKVVKANQFGSFKLENGRIHFQGSPSLKLPSPQDFGLQSLWLEPKSARLSTKANRKSRVWLKAAAVALPLGLAAFFLAQEDSRHAFTASLLSFGSEAQYQVRQDIVSTGDELMELEYAQGTVEIPESYYLNSHSLLRFNQQSFILKNQEIVNKLQGRYLIIVGCFRSLDNAENFVKRLQNSGLESSICGKHGDLYRVSAGDFDSRIVALQSLRKLKTQSRYARKAWISKF